MAKWYIALGITIFVAWYFFSYDAGIFRDTVDMGIWKDK